MDRYRIPIVSTAPRPRNVCSLRAIEASGRAPRGPGVYLFYSDDHQLLYVGKAKDLRRRVRQHFGGRIGKRPSRQQVVAAATEWLCWIETESELHALVLEDSLIKLWSPIANKQLKKWRLTKYIWVGEATPHPLRSVGIDESAPFVPRSRFGPYANRFVIQKLLELGTRYFGVGKLLRTDNGSIYPEMGVSKRCDLPGFERFLAAESDEIVDLIQHELETLVAALRFEEAATARERRTYAIGYLGRARFAHQFVYRNMAIRDSSTGQSWIFAQGSIVSWSPNGTGSSFDDNADQSFESSASRRTEPIEWALIDRANIVRRYISGAGNRYQHYFF